MDAEESHPRRSRKSVAFTENTVIVGPDGTVTMADATPDSPKEPTAASHTTPTDIDDVNPAPLDEKPSADDTGLDPTLMVKKKKKAVPAPDAAADGEDGGLDLSLKKKKKKVKKPEEGGDAFAAKLAALDLEGKEGEEAQPETEVQEGDMEKGTGIWQHDQTAPINYDLLLSRFFHLLAQRNPDHASSSSRSYKIPPPQCLREGNKKTIFANIAEICKRMKRTEEHVTAFIFSELGTTGSVDGSRRLVIKGRFQQKQIENVLRKYILEYLSCKTCRSLDTNLDKGENRLYFITCNSCGSRRSVSAIKTGFSAQIGKRRKMKG
ncbi:Domain found in IF2B/IF5 [Pleurostoma richardsiae]|uniref:Domain found in IF2B/IF5 n=1 Tax=Pleurostoma richardsiae TaxID=41990 RepID=A0AA38RQJ0_9PEZI|nr:Domain found in IF2B/IF5 [Pleurostoma richardsiae]